MKKLFALILALAMLFALAACGSEGTAELTRGTVTGSRYESSFLGIGCELDESWHVFSDEELAELMNVGVEMYSDPEKYRSLIESADVLQDFNASDGSGASVNIVFQKLSGASRLVDEDQYRDLSASALETTFTDAGLSNVAVVKNEIDLVGVTRPGTLATGTMYGLGFYSQQIYIKGSGYMAIITISSFHEEDIAALTGCFFALDK